MKTALMTTGEGYGNVIWSTPVAKALHNIGYIVDVFVESHWIDATLPFKNTFVRYTTNKLAPFSPETYDVILRTRWAKTNFPNQIKFDHVDYAKYHEALANFTVMRKIGYKDEMPSCFFADVTWMDGSYNNNDIINIAISDPEVRLPIWNRRKYPYVKELIKELLKAGYDVTMVGSKQDEKGWGNLPLGTKKIVEKNVYDMAQRLKWCDLYIGQDCGITQIAATIGMPTIALFGPTRISKNRPLGERVRVEKANLNCSPCQLLPAFGECIDFKCMRMFKPIDLVYIIKEELCNPLNRQIN